MIKVLIAEDKRLIGEGFKFIIDSDNEIEVVGLALNGYEAFELCKLHNPELVLMDLKMPCCDGIEGTKLIKSYSSDIKVLVLTTFDDDDIVAEALKNGADGYILKDINAEKLIATIKGTSKGLNVIDESVYQNIVNRFNQTDNKKPEYALTEREIKLIELVVCGKSNKEIAAALKITEGRVKNIITSILSKLGLSDRTSLAVYAVKNKYINKRFNYD
ncbi:DNA-binding NarL/FixJ family response regulator [Ruminiclostridium sufflavum DSM 19573]|uniref:Stage 0 sporulation protein A homolog n=1 Tax=Ruminiclostridium sufflavum DSM 19573 TaxID=1121337 RepID=A0A318XJC0_9FIRM|nr:response regulator transcription factor [Ruminiclostridium sufflavum]PYG86548.1 DNA-binding NarL/FixJ family response regulator [Ruminiclostridium sufflavum DSM 19573]